MPHPSRVVNLLGKTFSHLTVISFAGKNKHRMAMWNAQCVCGTVVTITRGNLVSGNTKSCGCKKISAVTTHGHKAQGTGMGNYRGSRTYNCWLAMKRRCLNPKCREWEHYGGRGIKICEQWMKFENFLNDMGEVPEGMSIDRRDNDLGYFKDNCRWATQEEQQGNRRTSVQIKIDGITKHLAAWARHFGLDDKVVARRRRSGWPENLWFSPLGSRLSDLLPQK